MVYASQTARCHQYERQVFSGDVVDCQHFVRQRYHKAAGSLDQHRIETLGEPLSCGLDFREVYGASVYARGQMRGCGIGEDFGHGVAAQVFGQQSGACDASVPQNILRDVGISGLYEFLGYRFSSLFVPCFGYVARGITFTYVGVDAAYEIDFSFFHFLRAMKYIGSYVSLTPPSHGNSVR